MMLRWVNVGCVFVLLGLVFEHSIILNQPACQGPNARLCHRGNGDVRAAGELSLEWQEPEGVGVKRFQFSRDRKDDVSG